MHAVGPIIGLTLFLFALRNIHHTFKGYHYADFHRALAAIPSDRVFMALALVALSYYLLTLYDVLAFRYANRAMPYRRLALTSFMGYALSNNVGVSFLSGGAIRYRLYSNWGVNTLDITKVIAFCTVTGWLGFATLGGVACLYEPTGLLPATYTSATLIRPLGCVLLGLVALYLASSLAQRKPLQFRSLEFALPPGRLALPQVALGFVDFTVAGAVLYMLMPADVTLSFPTFAGLFILALLAGLISQVPGGLGVFETIMIVLLAPYVPADRALSSLMLFRVLYYILPLLIAAILMAVYEVEQRTSALGPVAAATLTAISPLAPHLFGFLALVSGVILLVSGATPAVHGRMLILRDLFPLPVIEISHFLASVIGMALILLARALQRRLDAAYWLALALLAAGICLSLLKGLDYEEAAVLTLMLVAFAPCHREFRLRASLLSPRFSAGWIIGIGAVVLSVLWLGAFAHKHVEYSNELWWQFAFSGHAPRSLRATVGVLTLLFLFTLAKLLRPAAHPRKLPDAEEHALVRRIVAESPSASANLALLGDKMFLFNEAQTAFIMYGIAERCWVSMGDPVGPTEAHADLIWRFRELCDQNDAWPVFYQVHPKNLYLYPDVGLALFKFGEEARVDLSKFSLAGAAHKTERNTLHHLEKQGYVFDVVPRENVPPILPELRAVSDTWLQLKNTREKGFSLGRFDEAYLAEFAQAVVKKDGRILAFANLWQAANKAELSIDLMRSHADAPGSTMDFLLINLMQWGAAQGYDWFNLGMAPLSGVESREAAPLWNRMAAFVFRHGQAFYNFQGLRQYKEKFGPVWEPRYIASPGGIAFPRVLAGIAALVNRGIAGAVAK